MPSSVKPRKPRPVQNPASEEEKHKRRVHDNVEAAIDTEELRICYDIVAHLMSYPQALPFNEPVNWKLLKLPEYPKIIKKPMDLGTIKTKVLKNEIHRVDQFVSLIRLVFKNAMTFNAAGSPIYLDAEYLLQEFESMVNTSGFSEEELSNIAQLEASDAEIAELTKTVNALERELEKKKRMVEEANKKKEKRLQLADLKSKKIKLSEPRKPLTYEEKEILCQRITELEPDHLTRLLELISAYSSTNNDDEEVEIDIENLDDSTIIRVQSFVNKHLNSSEQHINTAE